MWSLLGRADGKGSQVKNPWGSGKGLYVVFPEVSGDGGRNGEVEIGSEISVGVMKPEERGGRWGVWIEWSGMARRTRLEDGYTSKE